MRVGCLLAVRTLVSASLVSRAVGAAQGTADSSRKRVEAGSAGEVADAQANDNDTSWLSDGAPLSARTRACAHGIDAT